MGKRMTDEMNTNRRKHYAFPHLVDENGKIKDTTRKLPFAWPLPVLPDDEGYPLESKELRRQLQRGDVEQILQEGAVRFLIVCSNPWFRWLTRDECFPFWEDEGKVHFYQNDKIYLDDYECGYYYLASEWLVNGCERVIALKMCH